MNKRFEDVLDDVLARSHTEPTTAVLGHYPDEAEALAPLLHAADVLGMLQETAVTLEPEWQTADRRAFLAQIAELPPAPVSPGPLMRLNRWIERCTQSMRNKIQQKEWVQMNTILAKMTVALMLILGIGGGTAALATDSMPDSPLYPVKLVMEDTQLAVSNGPAKRAELHLVMAQVRVQEMVQIAQDGDSRGVQVLTRLQTHLQQALYLAAQASDQEMVKLLSQMQTMLQAQIATAAKTQTQAGVHTQQMMGELNGILHQYQEQAQAGLQDPQLFRWGHGQNPAWEPPCSGGDCEPAGDGNQYGQDNEHSGPPAPGPGAGPGPGDGDCDGDCEPAGDGNQYGQDNEHSGPPAPGPGAGPGPGDGDCDGDCEPAGDENQYGQDNEHSGPPAPGPGAGPGPGDGDCDGDCEPAGDENKYGQDNEHSGPPAPGPGAGPGPGDGDCDGDCEPAGDQNGPQPDNGSGNGG